MQKRCRPSGRNHGPGCPRSARDALRTVTGLATPHFRGHLLQTRRTPKDDHVPAIPGTASPHVLPGGRLQTVCTCSPTTLIFFSLPSIGNARNRLSGDQNMAFEKGPGVQERPRLGPFRTSAPADELVRNHRDERHHAAVGRQGEVAREPSSLGRLNLKAHLGLNDGGCSPKWTTADRECSNEADGGKCCRNPERAPESTRWATPSCGSVSSRGMGIADVPAGAASDPSRDSGCTRAPVLRAGRHDSRRVHPSTRRGTVSEISSPTEGAGAGQHLVEHAAEGPDVRAACRRPAPRLLRAHVGGGAEEHALAPSSRESIVGEFVRSGPGPPASRATSFARPMRRTSSIIPSRTT